MTADLTYLVAGGALLLAVFLPQLLRHWAISAPMVLVGVGLLIGLTPLPDGLPVNPMENRATVEHVTELAVVVALMGVGLSIDRPLSLLRRASWRAWAPTRRLLVVAMPLTIGAVALLGWGVGGLAPALALLLGAVLAPTDPVLASDVQVAGPRPESEGSTGEDDEVRFSLTSEAGLNDGLAFPFVYAAVLLATEGAVSGWAWEWLSYYLVAKVVIGVVAGVAVGWVLARVAFRGRRRIDAPSAAERGESLLALAALVSAYGAGEVTGGYGFLSVFVCGMTMRSAERGHVYHQAMHELVERLERLLTLFVLLILGIALTRGLLETLDWRGVVLGILLIVVIRPLSAFVALAPWASDVDGTGGMTGAERAAVAFFGVRGVGSIYYLAYAAGESEALGTAWMWSTVAFTIVLSVMLHGVLATPVMKRLDLASGRLEARSGAA